MGTSESYISFVCEKLERFGNIRRRKMFGEYMVYVNDKPVVMVCDDTVFVKMLSCLADLLADRPTAPPYEGAKGHYVLDPDDRDTLRRAAALAEEVTPLPKKKNRKSKEN